MFKNKLPIFLIFLVLISSNSFYSVDGKQSQSTRTIDVIIQGFNFNPANINVDINEKISFNVTNLDGTTHTFTITNAIFNVDITLTAGQNKQVVFTAPSTPQSIGFRCKIHTSMTGSIIVSDPSVTNQTSISSTTSSTASSTPSTTSNSTTSTSANSVSSSTTETNITTNNVTTSTSLSISQVSIEFYMILISMISIALIGWNRRKSN